MSVSAQIQILKAPLSPEVSWDDHQSPKCMLSIAGVGNVIGLLFLPTDKLLQY